MKQVFEEFVNTGSMENFLFAEYEGKTMSERIKDIAEYIRRTKKMDASYDDDVYQEIVLVLMKTNKLHTTDLQKSIPEIISYFYEICKNIGRDYCRKVENVYQKNKETHYPKKISLEPELEEQKEEGVTATSPRPEQDFMEKANYDSLLAKTKELLSKKQYEAFNLCVLHEKTQEEAADVLDISQAAVNKRFSRGKKVLQESLDC